MSLVGFCAGFLGIHPDLNTRIVATFRPRLTNHNVPHGLMTGSDERFHRFVYGAGLTRPQLRKIRPRIEDFTDWRDCLSTRRSDVDEMLFESLLALRTDVGAARLQQATAGVFAIRPWFKHASRSFAQRLAIHCDALLVDATDMSDPENIRQAISASRRNTGRYLAERDTLSAGITLLTEAQLNRALAILDPERRDISLFEALKLVRDASSAFRARHPEHDSEVLAFVRHEALFHKCRLLQEIGSLDEAAKELPRLRESALELGTGLSHLEYARADASLSLARGMYDKSRQAIANGCCLYENAERRPGITMVSFLGRMLTWCQRTRKRVRVEELEAFSDSTSGEPPDEYTADWRGRIKYLYREGVQWDNLCAPACYVARISSLYLEPKLSRL